MNTITQKHDTRQLPKAQEHTLRIARRGAASWYSADAASRTRLDWLKTAAVQCIGAEAATNSTIIRRALAHYTAHIESLIGLAESHTNHERLLLIEANIGDVLSIPADVTTALPMRPFSAIKKDFVASKRTSAR